MKKLEKISALVLSYLFLAISINSTAQSVPVPEIDTSITHSQSIFYNGALQAPFSTGHVSITGNSEVEILSTSEVTLLPGFTASVDSGCDILTVGIRQCPEILIAKNVSHITCFNKTDGSIRLTCSGGVAPYSFNWSMPNNISALISHLPQGNYSVLITDQSGCTASDSTQIVEPPQITATVSTTNSNCHQPTGTASIIPSGGVGRYKFFWENDGSSDSSRDELYAGRYEILVEDSNNCEVQTQALISDINGPDLSYTIDAEVSCHGYNDARLSVNIPLYGPEPLFPCGTPYDRLPAGDHPVLLEDSNGCKTVQNVHISEPELLTIYPVLTKPDCGSNNGTIQASVRGGTPPYSFSWDNYISDSVNANLNSGSYKVLVVDSKGCSFESLIILPDSNSFDLEITTNDVKCNKSADGNASIHPIGGIGPYTYKWYNGEAEFGFNTDTIGELASGTYRVLVSDNSGCKSEGKVNIEYPKELEVQFNITQPTSDSASDGSLSLIVTGGIPPYSYEWSNQSSSSTISNLMSDAYTYSVSDNNACLLEGSLRLASLGTAKVFSPCLTSSLQTFNYAAIQAACTTCNPQPGLTELNIVTDFGADPTDYYSDQQSFEWASDFIQQNYCSSGVKLIIPFGTYIVGREDDFLPNTYLSGFSPLQFCGCQNITIEGELDPVTYAKPKIQFQDCLKYGAFDRTTGLRYLRNTQTPIGNNNDYIYAAFPSYILYFEHCSDFHIENLEFDGNINNLSIGGYWASDLAGINLPNGGIRLENCQVGVLLNCDVHHFGSDGLLIKDVMHGGAPFDMNIRVLFSKFNNNCRSGFHWNGGSSVYVNGSEFNYNGFGPWGGTKIRAGLEMEVDGPEFAHLSNGHFLDCGFKFNNGASIQSNGQYGLYRDASGGVHSLDPWYHDFIFKRCDVISSEDGYASYINNRNVTFECCNFAGQVMDAYDAYNSVLTDNFHTKFLYSTFNEEYYDPISLGLKSFTLNEGDCSAGTIGVATKQIRIENYKARVYFNGCKFNASRYNNWGFIWGKSSFIDKITIKNSVFTKKNGDWREPTVGTNPYLNYNHQLIDLVNVIVNENNKVYIPHQRRNPQNLLDPSTNCFCDYSSGLYSVGNTCWFANACSYNGVVSDLKVPRSGIGGYCDIAGPAGDPAFCHNFEPDGFTDASYVDPAQLVCIDKYSNPAFTQPYISIFPHIPPNSEPPLAWLEPELWPCNLIPPAPQRVKNSRSYSNRDLFSVYPTLSVEAIHIVNGGIGNNVYIYNVIGLLVKADKIRSDDQMIEIKMLQTGMYFIFIENKDGCKKILKTDK